MREIKFRAWNTKGMIYSGKTDLKFYVEGRYGKPYLLNRLEDNEWGMKQVDWLLMQYTGLKDKNGVEIYEGDILEHTNGTFKVEYGLCGFIVTKLKDQVGTSPTLSYLAEPVVVGNIYESPELLEASK